jgi:hypothetical protein
LFITSGNELKARKEHWKKVVARCKNIYKKKTSIFLGQRYRVSLKRGTMLKQKTPQQVYCRNCINNFKAVPKLSFFGFRKFRCPKCQHNVVWPLTAGFLLIYWLVISAAVIFRFASSGGPLQMVNLLDLFAVASIAAIVMNYILKGRMTP